MDEDGVRRRSVSSSCPAFSKCSMKLARQLGQLDITKAPEDRTHPAPARRSAARRKCCSSSTTSNPFPNPTATNSSPSSNACRRAVKRILTSRRRIGSVSEELILRTDSTRPPRWRLLADLARHSRLLAKTSETERVALYKETGGKPLLLRWVAGQLGRGSCRTIADALRLPEHVARLTTTRWSSSSATWWKSSLRRNTPVLCTYFTLPAIEAHCGGF